MIKYTLRCSNGHRFEAWFSSSDSCEDQLSAGLVGCAECGDSSVIKAPMAPSIARGAFPDASAPSPSPSPPPPTAPAAGAAPAPGAAEGAGREQVAVAGQVREALHQLRRFVEANADYVGNKFADEARKIHHGETEERSIYGETSEEEAEALTEEGVPFGSIPWPKNDA